MSDLTLTATDYHAKVLCAAAQEKAWICSWRQFCEQWITAQGIELISALEESMLWQEIAEEFASHNTEAMAADFAECDRLLQTYHISEQSLQNYDFAAVNVFRRALAQFQKKLIERKQTTFLRALKSLHQVPIPAKLRKKSVQLFGFVDFPPLYLGVIRNIELQGVAVNRLPDQNPAKLDNKPCKIEAKLIEAQNAEKEFLQALEFIENEWQKDPYQTFALVVQQSQLSWKKIHRLLKTRQTPLKISCSKGEALVDQPHFLFIQDFLQSFESDDLLLMTRVLVSPFWNEDQVRRVALDAWMRQNLMRITSLTQVLKSLLHQDPSIQETIWFQTWQKLANFDPRDANAFIKTFLNAAQLREFACPAPEYPNLHIVGALEAANLPVDAVWILSADSEHYPAPKSIPAFLPKSLLVDAKVPIALEEVYAYADRLLHAIGDGREVYASFVPMVKGERKSLSRLITGIPCKIKRQPDMSTGHCQDAAKADPNPVTYLPLPEGSLPVLKGGSALLKEQSECPFKAFAHFRLNVSGLEMGREVLDPLQKGLMVHAVLEEIWSILKTQQNLLKLDPDAQRNMIAKAVDTILNRLGTHARKKLIQKLERARLIRIIDEWLNLERIRPPFSVKATEVSELATVGGMQFRIRLDRIDEVEEGLLVIDYKIGEASEKGWFEERLREPQLPLYAVTNAATGAIFASLKVGKMGFAGVVADQQLAFDRVQTLSAGKTWEDQRELWHEQLEALVQEFRSGRVEVAPIDEKVCMYCDLSGFCRVKELKGE